MKIAYLTGKKAFTLVEMLLGITVFSIGLVGISLLFQTAVDTASYARHEVIASNLLREQIELIKNLRDSNWRSYRPWNIARISNPGGGAETTEIVPGIYLVENDFSSEIAEYASDTLSNIPVKMTSMKTPIPTDVKMIFSDPNLSSLLLCVGESGYTHDCSGENEKTQYASYLEVAPLEYMEGSDVDGGYMLTAHVIVGNANSARDYDLKTLITDWKK